MSSSSSSSSDALNTSRNFYEDNDVTVEEMYKQDAFIESTPSKDIGKAPQRSPSYRDDDDEEDTPSGDNINAYVRDLVIGNGVDKSTSRTTTVTMFISAALFFVVFFVYQNFLNVHQPQHFTGDIGDFQQEVSKLQEKIIILEKSLSEKATPDHITSATEKLQDAFKTELESIRMTLKADSEITDKINDVEKSLTKKIRDVNTAASEGADMSALQGLIEPIQIQNSEFGLEISELRETISTIRQEIEQNVKTKEMKEKTDSLDSSFADLQGKVSILEDTTSKSLTSDDLNEIISHIDELRSKFESLQVDLEGVKTSTDEAVSHETLLKEINDLREEMKSESNYQRNEVHSRMSEMKPKIDEAIQLKSKVSKLENIAVDFSQGIQDMEISIAAVVSDIRNDQSRITVLEDIYGDTSQNPINRDAVNILIDDAIEKFAADETGQIDYALHSIGGLVVEAEEEFIEQRDFFSSYATKERETLIQPTQKIGDCWPMAGQSGNVTLKLSQTIIPRSVVIEHISRMIAPRYQSAPRHFEVWGMIENENGYIMQHKNLGTNEPFEYDGTEKHLQVFELDNADQYKYVEFRILDNHGSQEYTCLYRLRVHGEPVEVEESESLDDPVESSDQGWLKSIGGILF